MDSGTQAALLIVWALFWMLTLTVMMVHPMFRSTRIQIRRSLRLNLNRWNAMQQLLRGRLLLRLGRTLLWLARRVEQLSAAPYWVRLLLRVANGTVLVYLFWHLVFRQPMSWEFLLGFLMGELGMQGVKAWRQRKKQRLQATTSGENTPIKSVRE